MWEAIFIYSFTIVQCFFEKNTPAISRFFLLEEKHNMKTLFYEFSDVNLKFENIIQPTKEVHLLIFSLDKNPERIMQLIKTLQNGRYSNYPMILFSKHKKYLVDAFLQLKPFQPALLPLNQQTISNLTEYVRFYYGIYKESLRETLVLDIPSCFYRIKIDNILFIEARNKKVSICTKDNQITEIPISFHDILEKIPENTLIQSHRSYIINPNNVTRIDRESKHWIVSFYNTDKKAFISRSYKQNALDITNAKEERNYPMIDSYYFQ